MNETMTPRLPESVAKGDGWVLFNIGGIWLAADQKHVRGLAEAREFIPSERPGCWIDPKHDWPAYLLDRRLNPVLGEKRRFAIFLESIHGPLGILCDEIQALAAANAGKPTPLPGIVTAYSPAAKALLRPDPGRVVVTLDPVMLAMHLDIGGYESQADQLEEELTP